MAADVIHQLVRDPPGRFVTVGKDSRTRCGIVACVETFGAFIVQMLDENGGKFKGASHADIVTCRKCINLNKTGNIHGKPSRSSSPSGRRPLDADRAAHASRRRRARALGAQVRNT